MILGILFIAGSAFGQEGMEDRKEKKTPEERAAHMTEKMQSDLELTDQQVAEVAVLNDAHTKEMEKIRSQMKELKKEAKALRKAHESELEKVLTAEQYAIHKEKMEKRKKRRMERPECPPGTCPKKD